MRLALSALLLAAALLAGCTASSDVRTEPFSAATAAAAERQILITVQQPASLAAGLTGAPNQR